MLEEYLRNRQEEYDEMKQHHDDHSRQKTKAAISLVKSIIRQHLS